MRAIPTRSLPAGAAATSAALLLTLAISAPAGAEPAADPSPAPVADEVLASAEEVLAPVTPDAHPVAAEVDLVEFASAEEVAATSPVEPVEPPSPTAEVASGQPVAPASGEVATEPAEPAESAEPTDGATAEPAESAEATESAEPAESAEPSEPTEPTESASAEPIDGFVAQADLPELAVVGVTWDAAGAPADLSVDYRTLVDGAWTDWAEFEVDNSFAEPGQSDRLGTEPLAVTDAEQIEVRLTTDAELPTGTNLAVIDPGTSSADTSVPEGEPVEQAGVQAITPMATTSATTNPARPTIYSRAQWGADESIRDWDPEVGRVTGVDIHHTAGANGYTSAEVPGILRGIYSYHAETWGRGWGDIGYNVLVDRFGRAWEGRYGGLDVAIIGAHATGMNSNMVGISIIGNYQDVAVPAAQFDMVARVAAWKLSIHGTTPIGTTTFNGSTYNRVIGHRDVADTSCPGNYMYNRLSELANRIASYQGSATNRILNRDLNADGTSDLIVRQGTSVSTLSVSTQSPWTHSVQGHGWSTSRTTVAGDWNGDGRTDLMLRDAAGVMWLYPRTASGFAARVRISGGWNVHNLVFGGHDWTGDGRVDLLARRASDSTLWLYASTSGGGLASGRQVGRGWGGMSAITMAGNFSGKPTLLATGRDGVLYAYTGDGLGGFSGSTVVSRSWSGMRATTGVGDWNRDGKVDFTAIDPSNRLWLYLGKGNGSTSERLQVGSGWSAHRLVLSAGRTGPGQSLYSVDTAGVLHLYSHSGRLPGLRPTGLTLASTDRDVTAIGDWDGDGRGDLAVRRSSGALMLHRGLAGGRYSATGTQIGTGWGTFQQIVGAGNWRGDGTPGILAYSRTTGDLWFYPGNGRGGFLARIPLTHGSGMSTLVNAGRWNGGGAPDVLMRGAEVGQLFHYNGTGAGLLRPATQVGTGWGAMRAIMGLNDVSGDGRADLVAVNASNQVLVYPGNGSGGFGSSVVFGTVPTGARVS